MRDALVDLLQEARVAVLVLHRFAALLARPGSRTRHDGRLGRLLRALPRRPGLTLNQVELLHFPRADLGEVTDGRLLPQLADVLKVGTDGRLCNGQLLGDRGLSEALQIELSNLLTPMGKHESFVVAGGHHPSPQWNLGHVRLVCLTVGVPRIEGDPGWITLRSPPPACEPP